MKNYPAKIILLITMAALVVLVLSFSGARNDYTRGNGNGNLYTIVKIIDGDTLIAYRDDQETTIRLLGINAPESSGPYRREECFGQESTEYLSSLLPIGALVDIQTDPSQDTYDKYKRLLGYVFLGKMNINEELVADGYAYEYTYRKPYRYQDVFRAAENEARSQNKGLWGICK